MENIALINLKNIKENAVKIKKALPKRCKFCAVVKADAYGHGDAEVASYIYNVADCFAVAKVSEGIKLRIAGIKKDILVLLPPSLDQIDGAIYYNLTLSVDKLCLVNQINNVALKQGKRAKIHIKYNTGMNRLGIDGLDNLENLLKSATIKKGVIVDGIYSHYANPSDNCMRNSATSKFLLANKLVKLYNKNVTCHISASGGFLQKEYFDMVRVGILLYGYKPFNDSSISVKPAMQVYSPLLTERALTVGDTALYGKCVSNIDQTINLVAYGYADGLPRSFAPSVPPDFANCLFNNRCMDISAVTQRVCQEEKAPYKKFIKNKKGVYLPVMTNADQTAKLYDTISYEVLTKSALRSQKIYIK